MTTNIARLRNELAQRISATRAVNQLLCHVLHCSPEYLYAYPERAINATAQKEISRLGQLLLDGMPIEYITGDCNFFSLRLQVSPAALIPRPETELLVEFAIRDAPPNGHVLELGTGCGAIAVALAKHRPDLTITATDISTDALKLALGNAKRYQLSNVNYIQGDWFEPLSPQRFQCIISNPPYVADDDPDLDAEVERYEPQLALFSGKTGMECLEQIIAQAPTYLDGQQGSLAVEHGCKQQDKVIRAMRQAGFSKVNPITDDAGLPRLSIGARQSEQQRFPISSFHSPKEIRCFNASSLFLILARKYSIGLSPLTLLQFPHNN